MMKPLESFPACIALIDSRRILRHMITPATLPCHWPALLGLPPHALTAGRMTYQLPRLRLHGLIERPRGIHRYRVIDSGLRLALFFMCVHARLFRPGLAVVMPDAAQDDAPLHQAFAQLQRAMD